MQVSENQSKYFYYHNLIIVNFDRCDRTHKVLHQINLQLNIPQTLVAQPLNLSLHRLFALASHKNTLINLG